MVRSSSALSHHGNVGSLTINPVIYAEVSVRFGTIEELAEVLPAEVFEYRPIPPEASFLAGKCFMQYGRRGGKKTLPLPDFLIGAHAAVEKLPLLTRDAGRFRDYFPSVELICP